MGLQFFLPVLIAIVLFVVVQYLTRKNILNINAFVRIRILLGCIFIGFLISEISQTESIKSFIILMLLAAIILAGVYNLQKKFFVLKKPSE